MTKVICLVDELELCITCCQKWLADELEVMVSVEEAKQHLQQLMADRKELAEQLRLTKAKLEGRLPTKVCCHYLHNPQINGLVTDFIDCI